MFRVLEIGANEQPMAESLYKSEDLGEVEVVQLDANPDAPHVDVVHELAYPEYPLPFEDEEFDAVIASHILEHIPYHAELNAIQDWVRVMKPGGTLNVVVPSAEFLARYILSEDASKYIKPYWVGGLTSAWDVHLNLFTMTMLRSLFGVCGLDVVRARTGPRVINSLGEEFTAEQHYIAGVKRGK